jgi:hypothetical protein
MNNAKATLRSVITFAVVVVLALLFGYYLTVNGGFRIDYTDPLDDLVVFMISVLVFPLLLRWHYPLMLLCWNLTVSAFFLPGSPSMALVMIALSFGISVLQRTLNKDSQFINVPQITLPLLCLLAVIVVTAKMTGMGLRTFGGDVYGGKKYVYLLGGIIGYFALSARRIPPERKNLYLGLFFLGGLTSFVADLVPWLPRWSYFIYNFFTYNEYFFRRGGLGETARYNGAVGTALAVFFYMLARYGIRGIFLEGKPWRWVIFILFFAYGLLGGFRTFVILVGLAFVLLFFLERLHRTKLLPVFLLVGLLGGIALIPLASHLPYTFQRALSFLPLNISPQAKLDAEATLDWRVDMWQGVMPQVSQYLFLGKGYVISPLDYNFVMGVDASVHSAFAENGGMALAEDYHNGPISVIIPFGIWGSIAFIWFLVAGVRVLYANHRYGDPSLRTVNTFLLAVFIARIIFFFTIIGAFSTDMLFFCGYLGLSVSLNGGVCRPVNKAPAAKSEAFRNFRRLPSAAAPAFQRRTG